MAETDDDGGILMLMKFFDKSSNRLEDATKKETEQLLHFVSHQVSLRGGGGEDCIKSPYPLFRAEIKWGEDSCD